MMIFEVMKRDLVCCKVAIIAAILAWSCIANAYVLQGRVVAVSDGDTVKVLDADRNQHKIRLMGIDAPEKAQAYGQKSKQHLSGLVFGRQVLVEWHKRDRYQRIVGKIFVAPLDCRTCDLTVDASLEQVKAGMAWWYRKYAIEQSAEDRLSYDAAEAEARNREIGLWREPDPMQPWVFRHKR